MDFIILIIACGVLLNAYIAYVVLTKGNRSVANYFFGIFVLSVICWSLTIWLITLYPAILMGSIIFAAVSVAIASFLFFILSFTNNRWFLSRLMRHSSIIALPALFFFIVSFIPNLLFKGVKIVNNSIVTQNGSLLALFGVYLLIYIGISIYLMLKQYLASQGSDKRRLRVIFYGLIIFLFGAIICNLILPLMEIYRFNVLGPVFSIFLVGSIAYAILKQGLFGIKTLLTEVAVVILTVVVTLQLISSSDFNQRIISCFVLIFIVMGGRLLIKSVNQEIHRREEVERLADERAKAYKELDERNRNLLALQRFSNIVLDNIELKPMIQSIIDTIPKEVKLCFGAFVVLIDKEKGKAQGFAISETSAIKQIGDILKKGIEDISYSADSNENMIMQAYHQQAMQRSNNIADFLVPPLDNGMIRQVKDIVHLSSMIAMPLSAGKEHYGILVCGLKVPVEKFPTEDMSMMVAIADEISLAIQRAMAYEELKKANEYLKQLDQMKDEFISVASHELNTPLAAIEGYLSMILDEHMGKVDKTAQEYLGRVYDSSKRLASLISDLLNVSRIEQGRIHLIYSQVHMEELIGSVINELIVKAQPKNIYLKFDKPAKPLPETWLDNNRMREVLINLVGNSIKFTEKGGITIAASADSKQFTVTVTDTGVGIEPGGAEKLFKKFSQLNREKNETQGSGLGLYISKNLVELHGGKIWVESKGIGHGTKFTFTIPIIKEKPADPYEGEGAVLKSAVKEPVPKEEKPLVSGATYTLGK